jgi:hypothetical protein
MRISRSWVLALRFVVVTSLAMSLIAGGSGRPASADENPFNVALNVALMNALAEPVLDPVADPPGSFKNVKPNQFDPAKSYLVQAAWLHGTGCPTNAQYQEFNPAPPFELRPAVYTDAACATGDPNDARNEGLLMFKTGPTNDNASAVAELINVKGMTLTELGYDIRKPGAGTQVGPQGSHCGAGAPRFNIVTTTDLFFLGCNSPAGTPTASGQGWIRLRWSPVVAYSATTGLLGGITGTVTRIVIVFDEGQDTGPDFFGAAILDNIDVNGKLVGRGAVQAN